MQSSVSSIFPFYVWIAVVSTLAGCATARQPSVEPTSAPAIRPALATARTGTQATGVQASRETGAHSFGIQPAAAQDDARSPDPALQPGAATATPTPPTRGERVAPRTIQEALHPPVMAEEVPSAPAPIELDMTGALAIVGDQSPRIELAAARYRQAYAQLTGARALWLPSLRGGASFNHHDGMIQDVAGFAFPTSRSALNAGLGAGAVGAGSPAVPGVVAQFHSADAVFQPRIAEFRASASDTAVQAATNDALLDAALAYLELLRCWQAEQIARDTLQRASQLADLTDSFARSGQGAQADADRAATEHVRRRNELTRAEEARHVAEVRMAELLRFDPTQPIAPSEETIVPVDLVPPGQPVGELIATGLSNRPELAEARLLVCEAVQRYRREKFAPLMPSALLGLSQSGFGAGKGSSIDRYDGRFDFDATVYWELRNLGLGERAKREETQAMYDQARAREAALLDRVAREVVEGATQVEMRRKIIEVAETGVQSATQSYERDLARIRQGAGLPIESLQSLRALDEARREYLRSLVDYNEAQFRLHRALGWPIQ